MPLNHGLRTVRYCCSAKRRTPPGRSGHSPCGIEKRRRSAMSRVRCFQPSPPFRPTVAGWPIRSERVARPKRRCTFSPSRRRARGIRSRAAAGQPGLVTARSCFSCRPRPSSRSFESGRNRPSRSRVQRLVPRRFGIADPANPRPVRHAARWTDSLEWPCRA